MRAINATGLRLVKAFEGAEDGDPTTVNLDPYLDPVGVWTIGWGHAIADPATGRFLRGPAAESRARELYPGGITFMQAEQLLIADLLDTAVNVSEAVRIPLDSDQFSALVSFDFNTGALRKSTLLKKLNAGDLAGAAAEFGRWTKGRVDGRLVTLPGLVRRRRAERRLFEGGGFEEATA